jgi:CheY-like chemotaxis protein
MTKSFCVLIVDDNRELVETFKDIFEFKDFEVRTAYSGAEAVALVKQHDFDAVVLDLVMPGMSGVETIQALNWLGSTAQVIVVTGYAESEQAEAARQQGVLRVFPKPLVVEDVVSLLCQLREDKPDAA